MTVPGTFRQHAAQSRRDEIQTASKIATLSAQIAGELYRARIIARQLALAAQNSRTMVARVGERAAGLDVLSAFFAELSRETIRLSDEVNRLATDIAHNSVSQWRVQRLQQALRASLQQNTADGFARFVEAQHAQGRARSAELSDNFRKIRAGLTDRLQQLDSHMRSASSLAVNFRLEATKTGEFEANLRDMAAAIEDRSLVIGEHAKRSISRLAELRQLNVIH